MVTLGFYILYFVIGFLAYCILRKICGRSVPVLIVTLIATALICILLGCLFESWLRIFSHFAETYGLPKGNGLLGTCGGGFAFGASNLSNFMK